MGDKPAKKPKRTWGASHREPYSIIFQAEVICDCRVGSHNLHHTEKYGINRSLVSKWLRNKNSVVESASSKHKNHLKKQWPSQKYLFQALLEKCERKGTMSSSTASGVMLESFIVSSKTNSWQSLKTCDCYFRRGSSVTWDVDNATKNY